MTSSCKTWIGPHSLSSMRALEWWKTHWTRLTLVFYATHHSSWALRSIHCWTQCAVTRDFDACWVHCNLSGREGSHSVLTSTGPWSRVTPETLFEIRRIPPLASIRSRTAPQFY